MGRVAMSCEDLRRALPLLPGTHTDDQARARAHAAGCEACAELLVAYEADDQALSALREGERQAPAILDGFTASVMARIAAEQPRVALPPREAQVLRPVFGEGLRRVAAAAAVLLAVTLGVMSGRVDDAAPSPAPSEGLAAGPGAGASAGVELVSTGPTQAVPVGVPTTRPEPLPAPRRDRDLAPMPQRRRGPIVPVGQGQAPRGRTLGGANQPGAQGELLEAIEQFLPNLHRRMLKEFGDERGEREVRF